MYSYFGDMIMLNSWSQPTTSEVVLPTQTLNSFWFVWDKYWKMSKYKDQYLEYLKFISKKD